MPTAPSTSTPSPDADADADPAPRGPLRIQAVAELTGVPSPTLRAWERRYGIPSPARTSSAYRLYTPEDVELVVAMRKLVEGGLSASDAAETVRAAPPRAAPGGEGPGDYFEAVVDRVLGAVAAYDADGIDREVALAALVASAHTVYERVVGPASVRIGVEWHEGKLTVAQEHLATERFTAILRAHLRLLQPPAPAKHVLLGSFADDEHVLGSLGAGICFASSGFRVTLLGARTSPTAIADAARALAPDLIGLSVTVAPPRPRARELVDGYADAAGAVPWVVGGGGAVELEQRVLARGGFVARGTGAEWLDEVRRWLRAESAAKAKRAQGGRTHRGGSR
jgi:DNA-binding transcriptional MerR regulator/methylmalonyl-CoA mutase cobalamin-binding subunit